MVVESTTALTQQSHILLMKLTLITATMATDLSAAFDTIDNVKVIDKLHFYGIEGNELEMFRSFLSESTQYVQIDTFKSESFICPPCSVVQGSKLSVVLYTIYTNEIPLCII